MRRTKDEAAAARRATDRRQRAEFRAQLARIESANATALARADRIKRARALGIDIEEL